MIYNYCGFCYADTSATAEDYDYYYENINFYAQKPETLGYYGILNHWVDIIKTNAARSDIILVDKNSVKVRDMNVEGFSIIGPDQLAERKMNGKICAFCAKGSESILRDIRALSIHNEVVVI